MFQHVVFTCKAPPTALQVAYEGALLVMKDKLVSVPVDALPETLRAIFHRAGERACAGVNQNMCLHCRFSQKPLATGFIRAGKWHVCRMFFHMPPVFWFSSERGSAVGPFTEKRFLPSMYLDVIRKGSVAG